LEAVAVGSGTVLRDNPSLTIRRGMLSHASSQPLRVVFDRRLRIPWNSTLLQDNFKTQLFSAEEPSNGLLKALKEGKYVDAIDDGPAGLRQALDVLARRHGVKRLLLEGGPGLAKAFLESNLVDRAAVITAGSVTFKEPIASGINTDVLTSAGLVRAGTFSCGGDVVQCWTRPDQPWPNPNGQL
jgi:diaminohydroxyphosphoribosylaminopyrimidine deaminase / 5-amino-6-(5-phosphoribosylamino)uracil reductase